MTSMPVACIFCRVINGDIPATLLHADETVVAFRDVNPQAPVHVLVVPRDHVPSIADLTLPRDADLWTGLLSAVQRVAHGEGLQQGGWRMVVNTGSNGGQTVDHLHVHVLGGRRLEWPPG